MTLAVAAFGADRKLGFHAEFPFAVAGVTLPAGAYTVERTMPTAPVVTLRNAATRRGTMVNFATVAASNENNGKPAIVFFCNNTGCSVAAIHNLVGGASHIGFEPKVKDPKAQMISLNLKPVQAE